jgi:hypothetical protein
MEDQKLDQTVWLSYDLGIDGDYSSLYKFLDKHKAKECGDSIAFFKYTYSKNKTLIKNIAEDLSKVVKFRDTDRLYLIFTRERKTVGTFFKGGRKRPPWEGYALEIEDEDSFDEA